MADKVQLIKKEIERVEQILDDFNKTHNNTIDNGIVSAKKNICKHIKSFIDSLPEESTDEANCTTKNDDLDFLAISLEETIGTSPHSREVIKEHLQKAAEWQKRQQEQQMNIALQTEYVKGLFDMREKMLKDAVDGIVCNGIGDNRYIREVEKDAISHACSNFNFNDKVKIIIVKED